MVSEMIMYQSMFLLGILLFGFFAYSFDNYSDKADEIRLETSLKRMNYEIGNRIIDLIETGKALLYKSYNFTISITIALDSIISHETYQFFFTEEYNVSGSGEYLGFLNVRATGEQNPISTFNLGFVNGTGNVIFDGATFLKSNSLNPSVVFIWDGNSQIIRFA